MSRIALGLMSISTLTPEEIEELITESVRRGITVFDIADIYGGNGKCEELLGQVFERKPGLREKIYLQTKVGIRKNPKRYDLSRQHIIEGVQASLKRLKTDHVDSLLLHRCDIFMDNAEVAAAVAYLQEHGYIRDFGVSNFSSAEIEYLKQEVKTPIRYNQLHLGLGNTTMIDQTFYTNVPNHLVSKAPDDLFFYLKREKIAIQCWSPYQMGLFEGSIFNAEKFPETYAVLHKYAEKYHTSECAIATAFLLKLDRNLTVITGSTKIDHIQQSLDGEAITLSHEDWYQLYNETGHRIL